MKIENHPNVCLFLYHFDAILSKTNWIPELVVAKFFEPFCARKVFIPKIPLKNENLNCQSFLHVSGHFEETFFHENCNVQKTELWT